MAILFLIVIALIVGWVLFHIVGGLLGLLIIGLLAGLIASSITKDYGQRGLIGNILLGWFGSIVSSILLHISGIGDWNHGLIMNLIFSTFGAVLLIWLARAFTSRRQSNNYGNYNNYR